MIISPFFTLCWTSFGGLVYLILLPIQNRAKDLNPLDFGATCFSFLSILNGFKLTSQVYIAYYNGEVKTFELDKFFAVYGGLCVIWIAVNALKKRFAVPVKA